MLDNLLFIFTLTFIFVRFFTYFLHNRSDINNSNTLTGLVRGKTGFDFHHVHFGFFLIFIFGIWLVFEKNFFVLSGLVVGLSLVCDQIVPLIFRRVCYFSCLGVFWAVFLHLIGAFFIWFLV